MIKGVKIMLISLIHKEKTEIKQKQTTTLDLICASTSTSNKSNLTKKPFVSTQCTF